MDEDRGQVPDGTVLPRPATGARRRTVVRRGVMDDEGYGKVISIQLPATGWFPNAPAAARSAIAAAS
jgi:hypothetical protein